MVYILLSLIGIQTRDCDAGNKYLLFICKEVGSSTNK